MAKVESFRFWCQKVLPLVYDDSLSYYELLCKVVTYLNNTIQAVNENTDDLAQMRSELTDFENRFITLKAYVDHYFDNLDVQEEINNKLDSMVESGELQELIEPYLIFITNNKVDKIPSRRFLFVGDSYIAAKSNTCIEKACSYLGITNYENLGISGSSFHDGRFLQQLTNWENGNRELITDIFVVGGFNDCIYDNISDAGALKTAINSFMNYADTYYPNAHVTVCFAGHAFDNAAELAGRTWVRREYCRYVYQATLAERGATFHGDLWEALAVNKIYLGSDSIHPSTYGQEALAVKLTEYIIGTPTQTIYPPYQLWSSNANLKYLVEGDSVVITLDSGALIIAEANQTIAGNDTVDIATDIGLYFNKLFKVPVFIRLDNANSKAYQNARGWLVFEGDKIKLKFDELADTGYQSYVFASNGTIVIEHICATVPLVNLL